MHDRRTQWMLLPLTILACLGFGMVPTSASAQSYSGYCTKIRQDGLDALDQKQWELVVSKGREFMSTCQDVGTETAAHVLFEIGFGLKKQGKFEEAVPIFRRCTTVKPDDTHCLTYLAEALDKLGEFEEVVPILTRCVTIKPDEAGCWVDLGIALDQAGRASEARKAYEQAISIGGFTEENAASIELARQCLAHPQTAATFRGHRLGESWQTFLRTEEGLCKIKINTESCSDAASGAEAMLSQHGKDGTVMFGFEYGRLASATVFMTGPAFAELTYFEKTYGEPAGKYSHPEEGTAESSWHFTDGGEAHAQESKSKSGEFTITFMIHASDSTLRPGPLAANPHTPIFNGRALGESWEKFAQTGSALCRASKDATQACKDAAAGEFATLIQIADGLIKTRFTFKSRRLTQAELNTRVPKFVELDYFDKTYGHPYTTTNSPEIGATRRWDYADGGQVLATEMPDAQGFLITISAKTIPLQ